MYKILVSIFLFTTFISHAQTTDSTKTKKDSVKQISEINVNAKKPVIEYKDGKTIYNVENSTAAAGIDVLSVLKKTSGVMVNSNSIFLAGKSSVSLMINERLQQMSMEDLMSTLRSMQSDQVARIEVIAKPSSKYDAEGSGGIINIILKKNTKEGIKGSATLSANYNSLWSATSNFNLNYKKGKWNSYLNYSGNQIAYEYNSWNETFYPAQFWRYDIKEQRRNRTIRMNFGTEYQINNKTTIALSIGDAYIKYYNAEKANGNGSYNNTTISNPITIGNTNDVYPLKLNSNINLEHKIDSLGKKISFDYDIYKQLGNKHRLFTTNDNLLGSTNNNITTGSPSTLIQSVKADVELPYKNFKISFGAKASFVKAQAINQFYYLQNSYLQNDTSKSNNYFYTENIQALYGTINKKINKIDYNLGCRLERTDVIGTSNTIQQRNVQRYTKLFPTLTINYSINDNHGIGLFATRRIFRPDYGFLNPFKFYYSPQSYSVGNAALQASTNILLSFLYHYKNNINVQFSYKHQYNYFDRVFLIDSAENTSRITRANIGEKDYLAIEAQYNFSIRKWWEVNGSINGAFSKFSPYAQYSNSRFQQSNYWVEMYNSFMLNKAKTLSADIGGFYYSPRITDVKLWKPMSSVNMSFKYLLMNKNLTITLIASDIFKKTYWLQVNKANGSTEYSYDNERGLQLIVNYKFGNKNIKGTKQRSAIEEVQRAGN